MGGQGRGLLWGVADVIACVCQISVRASVVWCWGNIRQHALFVDSALGRVAEFASRIVIRGFDCYSPGRLCWFRGATVRSMGDGFGVREMAA